MELKDPMFSPFDKPPQIQIKIPCAEAILRQGLRYFVGEQFVWLPEYDEVAAWLNNNNGKGLALVGNVGRGKTVLAMHILPAIIEWNVPIIDCDGFRHKSYVSRFSAQQITPQNFHEVKDSKLKVIDDIGTENSIVHFGNKIDTIPNIIDNAERKSQLLIITTNLTNISKHYDERTFDRLRSITKLVIFSGESLRK